MTETITGFYSDFDTTPVIMYTYERTSIDCIRKTPRIEESKKFVDFPEIVIDTNKKNASLAEIDFDAIKARIAQMKKDH